MLCDSTNIILGSGGRSALHGVWQRAHRQKRQERVRPPTVPLPGLRVSRVLAPKSRETAPERKAEVLRAVATERPSLRAAQRVFGVARGTISKWLEKKPQPSRR